MRTPVVEPASDAVCVVGAGAWGTTLAVLLARAGHQVTLVTHRAEHADALRRERVNARYLPGVAIPRAVGIVSDAGEAVPDAGLVLLVVPSQHVAASAAQLAPLLRGDALVVSCAKGFERGTARRLSEAIAEHARVDDARVVALSGPNLAREIVAGQPASSVVASRSHAAARVVQHALSGERFRVYTSDDIVGVEYGGALKNVIAIGAGVADGLDLGQNAKAAFITRGLAEMTRLGVAAGANPLTFGGLSGLGDLIATCESPLSRNRSFGERLGRGDTPADALAAMAHVVEGIDAARIAVELGRRHGVATPIADAVSGVLDGRLSVQQAIAALLARDARPERDDA